MDVKEIEKMGFKIRKTALETIQNAGSGHIGGSMSVADILAVLYFNKMNIDITNPQKEDRDRLVLSKGHCSPALYSALALKGFFPIEHLKTFRKIDSNLSGHVEINVPGVDMSAGSLGQGLSVALGMALYTRSKGYNSKIYAIMGDGEIQEGQIWEAAMAAGFYKTNNLIAFVDNNNLQLDGTLEEVMSPYPIAQKFKAFNWEVFEVDGHNIKMLIKAIEKAHKVKNKPSMIVASTIKGKGVSVFENQVKFHGGMPTDEEWNIAYTEINEKLGANGR